MYRVEISKGHYRTLGAPSIWKEEDIHEESSDWLNTDIMVASQSPHTWELAARAVQWWLNWCAETDQDWRQASRDDLVDWRDALCNSVSPRTGDIYSPNSVRVWMTYVFQFIDYAAAQGWYRGDIPVNRDTRPHYRPLDRDALAHTRRGATPSAVKRNKLLPKHQKSDVVSVLDERQQKALLRVMGPRPSQRDSSSYGSASDWLLIGIPLFTGLRRKEVVSSLSVHHFNCLTIGPTEENKLHPIVVEPRKNNKRSTVMFYGWLIRDIQAYIDGERKQALKKQNKQKPPSQLLLSRAGHPRAGQPLGVRSVNNIVERIMTRAGLVVEKPQIDPETGRRTIKTKPQFSMHALRHSYAVFHYIWRYNNGDAAPWKFIQMQLDHESPQTTMNTYLKFVHLFMNSNISFDVESWLSDA